MDADGDEVGANADLDDNDASVGAEVVNPDAIVTLTDVSAELGETASVFGNLSNQG